MDRTYYGGVNWKTKLEIVDVETGEEITKKHVSQGLYVVESKNTVIKQEEYGNTKIIQWFCRKNPQQRIEFK